MEKQSDSDMEHSDGEEFDMTHEKMEGKMFWLGDEEELKMELYHPEKDMGDEHDDRPLFNPASIVKNASSTCSQKSFSYVPYPKEEFTDTDTIFWTLQVKPKTMNTELVQMFYW